MEERRLRAALYARVSTLEQAREGYSIEGQQERLKAFAVAKDYIAHKPYIDPGYSGGNTDRPALQAMIRDIRAGLIDVVVVYKLDRLSRRQRDTLHLIEDVLLPNGVNFVSMSESLDTATPYGRAMVGILSAFAQLEREQTRERTILGRLDRAKSGLWHGGGGAERQLTGYRYEEGLLIEDEYESSAVRYIFDRYCEGRGIAKIFDEVSRKWPGVVGSASTVSNIIENPVYTGKIRFNGKSFPGLHAPLITEEQFQKAQELRRKRTTSGSAFASSYLLSGLIYCGHCGARICGRTGGKLKSGEPMKYYVCYSRQKAHRHMSKDANCVKKSTQKNKIEDVVLVQVKAITVEKIDEGHSEKQRKNDSSVFENELKEVEKQLDRLVDLYALGSIPQETIDKKTRELGKKRDHLMKELELLAIEDETMNIEEIKETLVELHRTDWNSLTIEQQRMILSKLINRITITNDETTIEWAF